jgi:peroxiredoxin
MIAPDRLKYYMMREVVSIFVLLAVTTANLAGPSASVPRKSPEFAINEPGGKTIMLSSFKGKVVVIEFLFLPSQHCLRLAATLNKLYGELGARGLQPVGIAFGRDADAANTYLATQTLKLTYPVGYASAGDVDSYLARGKDDILNIPQVVVIDRMGMILAQSGAKPGDPKLENEDSLRTLLQGLLKETPHAGSK